ncbi:MAG: (2Fe-2S)-binding protein [Sporomusaceae bacterium]|nr:(2Fe-2S)-binding protein [Sporomusaceae bacterium]
MEILNHNILGEIPKVKTITIKFEGKSILARVGQTVASALMANDVHKLGHSRNLSQPRGVYCGNGRCQSCIMTIDGIENVRSCRTLVKEGMIVKRCTGDPDVRRTL